MIIQELVDAGFHFGHRTSRWNPKMKLFIFGKRNLIHIINLRETVKGLVTACKFLTNLAQTNKDVCYLLAQNGKQEILRRVRLNVVECTMQTNDGWGDINKFRYHSVTLETSGRIRRLGENRCY